MFSAGCSLGCFVSMERLSFSFAHSIVLVSISTRSPLSSFSTGNGLFMQHLSRAPWTLKVIYITTQKSCICTQQTQNIRNLRVSPRDFCMSLRCGSWQRFMSKSLCDYSVDAVECSEWKSNVYQVKQTYPFLEKVFSNTVVAVTLKTFLHYMSVLCCV